MSTMLSLPRAQDAGYVVCGLLCLQLVVRCCPASAASEGLVEEAVELGEGFTEHGVVKQVNERHL